MSLTEHNSNAGAVGLFAGLLSVAFDWSSLNPTKMVTALVVAFLTGAGYKLGSVVIVNLLAKFKKQP